MLTPFERGLLAHLVADWLLQTSWMATNKASWKHPAAWVHAGVHAVALGLALGPLAGVVLGAIHLWIDTRAPLNWWLRVVKRCEDAPDVRNIALWTDQAMHLVAIALWVALVPG